MNSKILIATSLLLLSACSTAPSTDQTIDPPPANLASDCQGPEPLPNRPIAVGELVQGYVELAQAFIDCAVRHNGLKEWAEGVTAKRPQK